MPTNMDIREEIFPSQKREAYVQTEWAAGWMSTASGFGEAARRLTDQRRQIGAEIDQIGVAIFYLQRHRVELLIKGALDELGCAPEEVFRLGHDLRRLWLRLGAEIEGFSAQLWRELDHEATQFVEVLQEADTNAAQYRYPVGKTGGASRRAEFVDLHELQRHAEAFDSIIEGCIDWIDEARAAEAEFKEL